MSIVFPRVTNKEKNTQKRTEKKLYTRKKLVTKESSKWRIEEQNDMTYRKNGRSKSFHTSNYFKCKWIEAEICRMDEEP